MSANEDKVALRKINNFTLKINIGHKINNLITLLLFSLLFFIRIYRLR